MLPSCLVRSRLFAGRSLGRIDVFSKKRQWLLWFASLCFLVAGICGAVVGSSIPKYSKFADFAAAELGPLRESYDVWVDWEHSAFWVGVAVVIGAYVWHVIRTWKDKAAADKVDEQVALLRERVAALEALAVPHPE